MRRWWGRGLGLCATVIVVLAGGIQAGASAASWWPGEPVLSGNSHVGIAANAEGGFLLLDGLIGADSAFCPPGAGTFEPGGPQAPYAEGWGEAWVIPGSPSFMPN